ncbi:MAG: NUDIX hydrolase [Thermoprotei archaeon]
MVTQRRFADFGKNLPYYCMDRIPEGGMCLSVFLILYNRQMSNVLLGRVNPEYVDWEHIGALDQTRLSRFSPKWMLPSSHLILYESPTEAARRVLKEQLGLDGLKLDGPHVYTEVYDIERAGLRNHWDTEFIFRGELEKEPDPHPAWLELKFRDAKTMSEEEFARNHQDILRNVGVR